MKKPGLNKAFGAGLPALGKSSSRTTSADASGTNLASGSTNDVAKEPTVHAPPLPQGPTPALGEPTPDTAMPTMAQGTDAANDEVGLGAKGSTSFTSTELNTGGNVADKSLDEHDPSKVIPLHISAMKVWAGNPRHVIDDEKLDILIHTLREDGQQQPIEVILNPDQNDPVRYLIIAGQRRFLATRKGGLNNGYLLARVRTDLKTREEMLAAALATQATTDGLTDLDFAIAYAIEAQEHGGVRVFSRYVKSNPGEISKLTQIGGLPSSILNVLKTAPDKFSTTFSYEVVQVHSNLGEEKALQFARDIIEKNPSVRVVKHWREALLNPVVQSETSKKRRPWDVRNFTALDGALKTRESTGEVTLTVKSLRPETVNRLAQAIQEILQSEAGTPQ